MVCTCLPVVVFAEFVVVVVVVFAVFGNPDPDSDSAGISGSTRAIHCILN